MPSVRAVAVDPARGLVLLNLVGADASVSAVMMELLRSKSNGVGFMPTLFGSQQTNIPVQRPLSPSPKSCLSIPGRGCCLRKQPFASPGPYMETEQETQTMEQAIDIMVIGGGQAGLAVGSGRYFGRAGRLARSDGGTARSRLHTRHHQAGRSSESQS